MMERVNSILSHKLYRDLMNRIKEAEKDRIFCLHTISHSLDVARISSILNYKETLGLNEELIYATALLHDCGKAMKEEAYKSVDRDHAIAGLSSCMDILKDSGFSKEESDAILIAIAKHSLHCDIRQNEKYLQQMKIELNNEITSLSDLLFRADKLSRNCFMCDVYDTCYWNKEMKNEGIKI